MRAVWVFVTDCGDGAVTAPLALLAVVFLVAARERRLALAFAVSVGGCAALIGALKLAFMACGHPLTRFEIVSPSGHTALSTAVYGCLAMIVGGSLPPRRRLAAYAAAAVFVVTIAASRIVLQMHDPAEMVVGLEVGGIAVVAFAVATRRQAMPALPILWLVLGGVAVIAVMHGTRWMVEPAVHQFAGVFRLTLPWCR